MEATRPAGLIAIDREMARQHARCAGVLRWREGNRTGHRGLAEEDTAGCCLLGMGGSHAVGRAVEPLYRALGIDAIALPLSEQLGQPLSLDGRTVLITSQSGESAEVRALVQRNRRHCGHVRPNAGGRIVSRAHGTFTSSALAAQNWRLLRPAA